MIHNTACTLPSKNAHALVCPFKRGERIPSQTADGTRTEYAHGGHAGASAGSQDNEMQGTDQMERRDIAHSPNAAAVLLEILAQAELQRGQLLLAPLAAPELRLQRTNALRHLQESKLPQFQQMNTFAA